MATDTLTRRSLVTGLAAVPLLSAGASREGGSQTLVAFFSRSGNTRVIAGTLQRALGATLFEIVPATPYPADYLQTVAQATSERDRGFEPPLESQVVNFDRYTNVWLGFPIWGETAPPVIRSFLHTHDLSGKTVIPFITHGGYGLGGSRAVLESHAPRATWRAAFSMEADQERRTMNTVNDWLKRAST
jgi:flavodoxin